MYHDRTAWRCEFFVGKNMDVAKDIHKETLPRWIHIKFGFESSHNTVCFYEIPAQNSRVAVK
jgi:hypothetical protein